MTIDNPTTEYLEKDIEETRSSLAGTLDALAERVSAETWLSDLSSAVHDNTADLGKSVRRAAEENPGALLAAGAGLALVAFGAAKVLQAQSAASKRSGTAHQSFDDDGNAHYRGYDRKESHAGVGFAGSRGSSAMVPADDTLSPEFDRRVAAADAVSRSGEDRADAKAQDPWGIHADGPAGGSSTEDGAEPGLQDRSSGKAAQLYSAAKTRAADLHAQITSGLEEFNQEAQERIMTARLRATEAQRDIEAQARKAAGTTKSQFQKHPLAFGLGALALGALGASFLPRSDDEQRRTKEVRDRLMDEARRIYSDERQKLTAAASAALREGETQLRDAAKTVLDDGAGQVDAKSAAQKVKAAARQSYSDTSKKTAATAAPSTGSPAKADEERSALSNSSA